MHYLFVHNKLNNSTSQLMRACVYLCSKHSLHRLEQLVCVVSERACILFKHTEQGPRLQTPVNTGRIQFSIFR